MARNEEKQQGKLNRLWLQKEREEGRIKVQERRPKLSTLNSASSVKKWIPSIKSEIEYYLQQSQLSHYPERKIAEFQLCIQGLEKEYKRFITKLRAIDPTCKHKPWTPRAYTKRRLDAQDCPSPVAKQHRFESRDPSCPLRVSESEWANEKTGSDETTCERHGHFSQSNTQPDAGLAPIKLSLASSDHVNVDQDQPLTFDHTRLAVAVAGSRGPLVHPDSSHTHSLTRVLFSRLPNLHSSPLGRTLEAQSRDNSWAGEKRIWDGSTTGPRPDSESKDTTQRTVTSSSTVTTQEKMGHVLGLGCYSSSDEELDS